MANLISELKASGLVLTDEQLVQGMIRSIPGGRQWDSFKQNLTYDDNIKTFKDVNRHLVLEEERLQAEKISHESYVVDASHGRNRNKAQKRNKNGSKAVSNKY